MAKAPLVFKAQGVICTSAAPLDPPLGGVVASPDGHPSILAWPDSQRSQDSPNGHVRAGGLQSRRLQHLVAHARAHSPYYREHYRDVPPAVADPSQLPVTTKKALMDRFDDWVTDPRLSFDQVRAFSRDVQRIGEQFLGTYTVATTSGTTGVRGMFVFDERTMKVTKAFAMRMLGDWLSWRDMLKIVRSGGRISMVMAAGGHFASAVAAARMEKHGRNRRLQVLSVHMPLPEIVRALNEFQPAVIAPCASMHGSSAGQ